MMKLSTSRRRRSGFTLLELLLVIAILLVLGGVSVGVYIQIKASSDKKAAQLLVNDVTSILKRYHQEVGLPSEGLKEVVDGPAEEGLKTKWEEGAPYFEGGKIPIDPWGTELGFVLEQNDETAKRTGVYFHAYSFGPNRTDDNGTGDDVPAWAEQTNE